MFIVPDLADWEVYCRECGEFRLAHRATETDAETQEQYFEFVCSTCFTILLTFQRTSKSERFPATLRS